MTSRLLTVLEKLQARGYIDDAKFSRFWLENRNLKKGISIKKITMELKQKGIKDDVISSCLNDSDRDEASEIRKIIAKKSKKYDDQKLIQYLVRQGFDFDTVKTEVREKGSQNSA